MAALTLIVAALAVVAAAGCATDDDCSLNGVCSNNACKCDVPWGSHNCSTLRFATLSKPPAAYGFSPNVTSWGGNALYWDPQDGGDGQYHMFVTEIAGANCGLQQWHNQSTVVHAVSKTLGGPYLKHDLALPHQAHNPQAFRYGKKWYIIHIGSATGQSPVRNCTSPSSRSSTMNLQAPQAEATGSSLHESDTPFGPWAPVPDAPACNNPSPFVHPNGTLFVVCNPWSLKRAPSPHGPWTTIKPTPITPGTGIPPNPRRWEDPYFWIDARGHWHILAHTYMMAPYPAISFSGHGFSRDGLHWQWSPIEPYNGTLAYGDGSTERFATLERPKLLFHGGLTPLYLTNGASPQWPCDGCGHCSACKTTEGRDWTYTMIRPLAME